MKSGDMLDTMKALTEELTLLESIPDYHTTSGGRRLYIRTTFSLLEAFGCIIRERAMQLLARRLSEKGEIHIQQAHFLDDYGYALTETGTIERKNRSDYPFLAHFAFSIRTLAELAGHTAPIIQGPGWDRLRKAVRIRNRITHAKQISDIEVTDEEFGDVNEGVVWAMTTCLEVMHNSPYFVKKEDNERE